MTTNECGQRLYEDGAFVAVCTRERGTEHDHSDMTASDAIARGIARPATAGESTDAVHDEGRIHG